ncbi:glucose 1-dehydrogenase [Sphingomonas crocodyli]|uniref:Glucose 1-dehydrogenase n=1 Tax=Sphingomonas crocodyli TaxID=1979270 RepID=A0A437M9Y8_9SPHN|nr:glucose 1-dehydrogenase [Sphingomonas crocodyli]RVT94442.1 glucose 1-dehydrogenase [Sphingomonas crocodyli]
MNRLKGRVAIVTGGARGIGGAIAKRFVDEGAQVAISDILVADGEALAKELGEAAIFIRADVKSADDWAMLVKAVVDRFGGVDILVNNAGGAPGIGNLIDETEEFHRHVVDLNLTGTWAGIKAVIPAMRARGGGSIVNISSMDGLVGVPGVASYCAAKFAVTGLTKSAALELGRFGIRVNSIHPGMIGTPLVLQSGAATLSRVEKSLAHQPIRRMGKPEEVAAAAAFFASDDSSFCTGSELLVDGGHIAGPAREEVGGLVMHEGQ